MFSHITPMFHKALQVLYQMQQLLILLILIKWNDWYPIFQLVPKRIHSIIHYQQILKVPTICKNS